MICDDKVFRVFRAQTREICNGLTSALSGSKINSPPEARPDGGVGWWGRYNSECLNWWRCWIRWRLGGDVEVDRWLTAAWWWVLICCANWMEKTSWSKQLMERMSEHTDVWEISYGFRHSRVFPPVRCARQICLLVLRLLSQTILKFSPGR